MPEASISLGGKGLPEILRELQEKIENLEKRVQELEKSSGTSNQSKPDNHW